MLPVIIEDLKNTVQSYVKYPTRKLQSEAYTGPITIPMFERVQHVREQLKKEGIDLTMPSVN